MRDRIYSLQIAYGLIAGCLLLFFASCARKNNYLPISEDVLITKNYPDEYSVEDPNHKWYGWDGVSVSYLNTYEGCNSILLKPSNDISSYVCYQLAVDEVAGDSISFSGKYKYKNATDTSVQIGIRQNTMYDEFTQTSIRFDKITGHKGWTSFHVKAALNKDTYQILFFIRAKGDIKLWISGCEISSDGIPVQPRTGFGALKDHQFDQGSDIQLSDTTPQVVENLEVLGKVWGFLKYYHPEVTKGKYD